MTDQIERVARAICKADRYDADSSWPVYADQARAAIAAASEWQDISTAPKDGTRILLWQSWPVGGVYPAAWVKEPHKFWRRDSGGDVTRPTYWQPLPQPPKVTP